MRDTVFIIMALGRPDVETVFQKVYKPLCQSFNLEPIRVDLDEKGEPLNDEILNGIKQSKLIIADLTHERPNCYLEVGYTLGIGKKANLILTACETHDPRRDGRENDPKVHFDLDGRHLLFWESDSLIEFSELLKEKMRKRLEHLPNVIKKKDDQESEESHIQQWASQHVDVGGTIVGQNPSTPYLQVVFGLSNPEGMQFGNSDLLEIARVASSNTRIIGIPIAEVSHTSDFSPKPSASGIKAVFKSEEFFAYWALSNNGSLYSIRSLDLHDKGKKEFTATILALACYELFHYQYYLYSIMKVKESKQIKTRATLLNANGCQLAGDSEGNFPWSDGHICTENIINSPVSTTYDYRVNSLANKKLHHAYHLITPLFEMFDFFSLRRDEFEAIVNYYVKDAE